MRRLRPTTSCGERTLRCTRGLTRGDQAAFRTFGLGTREHHRDACFRVVPSPLTWRVGFDVRLRPRKRTLAPVRLDPTVAARSTPLFGAFEARSPPRRAALQRTRRETTEMCTTENCQSHSSRTSTHHACGYRERFALSRGVSWCPERFTTPRALRRLMRPLRGRFFPLRSGRDMARL